MIAARSGVETEDNANDAAPLLQVVLPAAASQYAHFRIVGLISYSERLKRAPGGRTSVSSS
jgi:hypothetical protein